MSGHRGSGGGRPVAGPRNAGNEVCQFRSRGSPTLVVAVCQLLNDTASAIDIQVGQQIPIRIGNIGLLWLLLVGT